MAYSPPPKFYPVIVETPGGEFELSQPWHIWFLNLGRDLGLSGAEITAMLARITAAEAAIVGLALRTATGWKDLVASIASAPVGAVAPTYQNFGAAGTLQRREYAFAINDYVFLPPFHINHDTKPGGQAYLHIHWSTNGVSTATVKWEFHIQRALGHNQANFPAPTAITVTQAAAGTAWRHMIAEVDVANALTLTEPDELLLVTVRRVTNGGVDNADNVFGLMVGIHYEADRDATPNKAPNFYA